MTKKKHGGKRAGAGKPLKYGERMKMVSLRLPISRIKEVKEVIKSFLAENIKSNNIENQTVKK